MVKVETGGSVGAGSTEITKTGAWRTFVPVVDPRKCIKCSLCEIYCPEGCIHQVRSNDKAAMAALGYSPKEIERLQGLVQGEKTLFLPDKNYCKGCGICVHECPRAARNAIKLELEEK